MDRTRRSPHSTHCSSEHLPRHRRHGLWSERGADACSQGLAAVTRQRLAEICVVTAGSLTRRRQGEHIARVSVLGALPGCVAA